jgi:hypothetical protein
MRVDWMSEEESGPEDDEEREKWATDLGLDTDENGRKQTTFFHKNGGQKVLEIKSVAYRTKEASLTLLTGD